MRDLTPLSLTPEATLQQAVAAIDATHAKIALVFENGGRLLGTITDGDVRRALLKGFDLAQPVSAMMNRHPITAPAGTTHEAAVALMQQRGIQQLPLLDAAGHVSELALIAEPPQQDAWVVLMAGGEGQRLRPLTEDTPKPLLPVGGRPLIETLVRRFAEQGFRRIFLAVNYKAEMFQAHFGDGTAFGVSIEYLREPEALGTGGALSLLPACDVPLIVMNGDVLTAVDFRNLLKFHDSHQAVATLCAREFGFQIPYGVVEVDGHRLKRHREKPKQQILVNAGIYVLSPTALAMIPAGSRYDLPSLFDRLVAEGRETAVFPLREYWLDIGRLDDLERARGEFAQNFD